MRKYFTFIALLLALAVAHADDINRQQAKQIAKDFFANRGIQMLDNGNSGMKKAAVRDNAVAPYHVFNAGSDKGFVIVSGSDVTEQILGYTDSGTFNEDNLPPSLKSWLQSYSKQIEWAEANKSTIQKASKAKRKASITRHAIAPLMKTKWNQGDPYNRSCPDYYNSDGSGGRAVTGCAATALAQIVYFHGQPYETVGTIAAHSNTYNVNGTNKVVRLEAVPAGTKIDMDNMCHEYHGDETEEQKQAVADLMLYVGQSIGMHYGSESACTYHKAEMMFEDYFGYDDGGKYYFEADFGVQEWFDMVYNELAAGYPVPYTGFSGAGGGHAFVVDGFDGEGLFHLDWGWGGGSNGWFRLNVLNSGDHSGLNASPSPDGFGVWHSAMFGIRYRDSDTMHPDDYNLTISKPSVRGDIIRSSVRNNGSEARDIEVALVMTGENGRFKALGEIQTFEQVGSNTSKAITFDFEEHSIQPGEYRVTTAARPKGQIEWLPFNRLNGDCVIITVDENLNVTLEAHQKEFNLEILSWEIQENIIIGQNNKLKVTFKNNGDEVYTEPELHYSTTDQMGEVRNRTTLRMRPGETMSAIFYFNPDAAGTWNLWIKNGNNIYGKTQLVVPEQSTLKKANLRVSSSSVQTLYGTTLAGTLTISNNSTTPFTGEINLYLWIDGRDGWFYGRQGYNVLIENLEKGKDQKIPFKFENVETGIYHTVTANYTTQDGRLDNAGIGNQGWTLQPGVMRWSNKGVLNGVAVSATMTFQSSFAGALFTGECPTSINPGRNPNLIFAFKNDAKIPAGLEESNVVIGSSAEVINFVNNDSFYSPVDFTAKKATFAYTFSTTGDGTKGWEAIVLPFKPETVTIDGEPAAWKTANQEGDFLLREFSHQDNHGNVIFSDVEGIESLRGNNPYIISATEKLAGKTVVFTGSDVNISNTGNAKMVVSTDEFRFYGNTYEPKMADIYLLNATGDAYEYVAESTTLKPFSNYFVTTLSTDERPQSIKIAADATGISDITTEKPNQDNRIYDMQGRIVKTPTSGIYIKNGRKFVK